MADAIGEGIITDMIFVGMKEALEHGRDVIIDQTNCRYKYIYRLLSEYEDIADIKFKILTEDLQTLKKRNQLRAIETRIPPVPDSIIEGMFRSQQALMEMEEFKKDLEEHGCLV